MSIVFSMILGAVLAAGYVIVPPGPEPVQCGPSADPWNVPSHVLNPCDQPPGLYYMGPGEE